jgi:hypothetical protein
MVRTLVSRRWVSRKLVEGASDLFVPLRGGSAERFVHRVLDRARAQLSPGGTERLLVDVHEMLAHESSIYRS